MEDWKQKFAWVPRRMKDVDGTHMHLLFESYEERRIDQLVVERRYKGTHVREVMSAGFPIGTIGGGLQGLAARLQRWVEALRCLARFFYF